MTGGRTQGRRTGAVAAQVRVKWVADHTAEREAPNPHRCGTVASAGGLPGNSISKNKLKNNWHNKNTGNVFNCFDQRPKPSALGEKSILVLQRGDVPFTLPGASMRRRKTRGRWGRATLGAMGSGRHPIGPIAHTAAHAALVAALFAAGSRSGAGRGSPLVGRPTFIVAVCVPRRVWRFLSGVSLPALHCEGGGD